MSITVTLRGVNYTLAQDGDQDYGAYMSQLINALVNQVNNTPLSTNTVQYNYVVSSDATKRTHASLEAVIADAAVLAGSNVLVDGVSFTQSTTLDITKKLYIFGLGNSTFKAAAGLGTDPIIKFSADGILFNGFVLDANANTPDYAIEIDAGVMGCVINAEIKGAFGVGDIDNGSVDEAIAGVIKKDSGNYLLPVSLIGANSALSNLASPTAINEDLVYDTNNIYDLGSDAIENKDVWTHRIAHNDALNPTLMIETTDNDGNISIKPNGAGVVILDTTIEIESGSIDENTEDLTISASALGKDLKLSATEDVDITATNGDLNVTVGGDVVLNANSDVYTIDKGGNTLDVVGSKLIQDYTEVKSVGSASQQFAGRDYTLAELEAYFTAAKVISFYKFGAGAALGTDEKAAYNYTLGAAAKAPSNGTGIMGLADTAISFDGGDYATNATKFDDMTTRFSGAGKGLIHSFWFSAPADGQPAAEGRLFFKRNSAANDFYAVALEPSGVINLHTRGNSATTKDCYSSTVLPNGVNTLWYHIVCVWNTTNGMQLYINSKLESQDRTATTLMVDGTTIDFFIGADDTTPTTPLTGLIVNEVVINDVCTQAMVDFLYATTIPLPAVLQGEDMVVTALMKPSVGGISTQVWYDEVQRRTTDVLISGGTRRSTDYYKYVGRV